MATTERAAISVIRSGDRDGWSVLVDQPGAIPSRGSERSIFTSPDGRFTTGLWEREPDTWTFSRSYDEVALILSGAAEVEEPDGTVHHIGPGDVMVTPKGSEGTWRITETIVKLYAIHER